MGYRVALAQINSTVGDIPGNTRKIMEYIKKARERRADLVVFPELAITGCPPRDLLLKPSFIRDNRRALEMIIDETEEITAVVGFVDYSELPPVKNIYDPSVLPKNPLYNAAALIRDKKLIGTQYKIHLPNYDVFDEKRYFEPGSESSIFDLDGIRIGVNICEDIWIDNGPFEVQAKKGADLIVNITASPFYAGKTRIRREFIRRRAKENRVAVVYLNLVGGQDDLVFDGGSYLFNREGEPIACCKQFEEELLVADLDGDKITLPEADPIEEIYGALLLGIGDYVRKNGFSKVVIGLSGGIDSAVTAALARDALGADNVVGVSMPSKVTSRSSIEDAEKLSQNLGITFKIIPIHRIVDAYTDALSSEFEGMAPDVTEENIQARIRGNILMALSNRFGYLVLSTGNKSELAVGYCTLYGDMAGGLAVISDVPKTLVYELARYINTIGEKEVIPDNILKKEPSAELREGQKDSDALPPYEVLDAILHAYIEEHKSKDEIIEMGFDEKVVSDVIWRVDHNEYKRQQAPPGIKITPRAFGSGRRMPITNRYEG
ncbi:MAG: NAD+ synthase [Candidatus Syntrophoarchaeum sp. WYZ-LMO15]|nr:MAG: NAD+ synthase [Candidatus Syntrophoarchaeum sp. WYZ-LMO15]